MKQKSFTSLEQKAKAYDEAIKRAKSAIKECGNNQGRIAMIESIFPELKESEDDRIRKALVEMVHDTTGDELWVDYNVHKEDALAWLEKQKDCEYIKKDWLEHIKQSWYKEGFIDGKYNGGTSKEWTINDAVTLKELIDFLENGTAKLQHDLTRYANWLKIQFTPIEKQGEQKPTIEMISAEESLGIDSETYKKIVDECIYGDDKQKLAWGEEDECYMSECIGAIATKDGWSFEEKRKTKHWLKALKDRYTWKPSDEQMKALKYASNDCSIAFADMKILATLYEQLKALHRYEQNT